MINYVVHYLMIVMNVIIIFQILKKEEETPMNMKQNINVINFLNHFKYLHLIII
jgi:hypothetical protein